MKKPISIIALLLLCAGMNVMAAGNPISYVKTEGKILFGKNLKIGLFKTRIVTDEGIVKKIPNQKVEAYLVESKQFENLPLLRTEKGKSTMVMMEYVAYRGGLKLYRLPAGEGRNQTYTYCVYKDNKLYLPVDQSNAESILPFFGVQVI